MRADQNAGSALPAVGRGTGGKARDRGHPAARIDPGLSDALQADLQSSFALARRRRASIPAESGKFARLRELGEEIAARQEKVLVFTQFREMTDPLAAHLEQHVRPRRPRPARRHAGERTATAGRAISAGWRPAVFRPLAQGRRHGLNLTAASHVIHFDRWWNPAVENQATDRAFRIGQKRNVLVHKFVCRGTIEERIDALIEEKRVCRRTARRGRRRKSAHGNVR